MLLTVPFGIFPLAGKNVSSQSTFTPYRPKRYACAEPRTVQAHFTINQVNVNVPFDLTPQGHTMTVAASQHQGKSQDTSLHFGRKLSPLG